jgi:uncharacterized membrane protein YcaP (DUF421 family)
MKPDDIKINDWMRILFGDAPYEFLIEVVIRILFIYILLVVSMRLMGRRMEAMSTRNELIAMVSLAAAIGVPMLSPDRGLLPAVVIAIVVIGIQHLIAWLTTKSRKNELILIGDVSTLVMDGRLQTSDMQRNRITRERLLSQLRSESIINLATVERMYMESNGEFTTLIYEDEVDRKGLCMLPEFDSEYRKEFKYADDAFACKSCGNVIDEKPTDGNKCLSCGANDWESAVISNK